MPLTDEQKSDIADAVNTTFAGNPQASADQITQEVADMMTDVINEIANCSRQAAGALHASFAVFYRGNPIVYIIREIGYNAIAALLEDWYQDLYHRYAYRACRASAVARWRSPLTDVLQGLYRSPSPPASGEEENSEQ